MNTITVPTSTETQTENVLSDEELLAPVPREPKVPITNVPHGDLLLNLAEEHGFREGFCRWAEAICRVYDETALSAERGIDDLTTRARVEHAELEQERHRRYVVEMNTRMAEFAKDDTPLRATLRAMIERIGILGTARRLEWEPRTVIGWALGPISALKWQQWVAVDRFLACGCSAVQAAHICGVRPALVKGLFANGRAVHTTAH